MRLALLGLLALPALAQDSGLVANEVRTVELAAVDPQAPDKGAECVLPFASPADGTLFLWAAAEGRAPTLLVADEHGASLAEDAQTGGPGTPFVRLEVKSGRRLSVRVRANAAGSIELHVGLATESDATRGAALAGRAATAELAALRAKGEREPATKCLELASAALLGAESAPRSFAIAEASQELALAARELGATEIELRLWNALFAQHGAFLPPSHPEFLRARLQHALCLDEHGEVQRSLDETRAVCDALALTHQEDDPELLAARQNIALLLGKRRQLPEALALEQQILAARERALPADDPLVLVARRNLAITYSDLGDHEHARDIQEEVLASVQRTRGPDDLELQIARVNLAHSLMSLGDIDRAGELQTAAVAVLERTQPPDSHYLAGARLNSGITAFARGRTREALALFEQVLAVYERTLPGDHRDLQAVRLDVAIVLDALEDRDRARTIMERVIEVFERTLPPDSAELQAARLSLAGLLQKLGDLSAAREIDEQLLALRSRTLPEDSPDLQAARQNLAIVLRESGDVSGARALEEKVLEVRTRTLPADHPDLQAARGNLAMTLIELGEFEAAGRLQDLVLEARLKALPADHPDIQIARLNRGYTLRLQGQHARAQALLEQALEAMLRILPEGRDGVLRARDNLAWIALALGRPDEARKQAAAALECARESVLRAQTLLAPREVELLAMRRMLETDIALSLSAGGPGVEPDAALEAQAFACVETLRGVGLAQARALRAAGQDPELMQLREQARRASEGVAQLAANGAERDELADAVRERDHVQRELAELLERKGVRDAAAGLDRASLAKALQPGQALVAYWRYDRTRWQAGAPGALATESSLLAFVLKPDGRLTRIELGAADAIEVAVDRWRDAVRDSTARGVAAQDAHPDERMLAQALRTLVWDPLQAALGDARVVIVAPDDVLYLVPLDALPQGEGFVGDRVAVRPCTAAIELFAPPPSRATTARLIALGGIDFDAAPAALEAAAPALAPLVVAAVASGSGGPAFAARGGVWEKGFTPLPETGGEVRAIGELFVKSFADAPAPALLLGAQAGRLALVELASGARFLHLATHGYFAPDSIPSVADPRPIDAKLGILAFSTSEEQVRGLSPMLLCGLAFAGANLPPDRTGRLAGTLTAEELAALDLSGCELAVLSACDTNVGLRRDGLGVASLQRALHMAGAQTALTSLWKVPDEATRELMVDFYRRIWVQKKPKAQALWEAKQRLAGLRDPRGRPQYDVRDWAGWVLTGDTR